MESFMCAPVGSFQKGVGDADGGSAPHRKHSIAIATGPRQIAAGAIGLTSPLRCSYSATAAFRAFKMPRKRKTPMSDSQPVRRPLAVLEHVRIGPAGWSYSDWAGYVYPSPRPKGFHEATYLAQFFDTIEINTSFYQPLNPEHARQWVDRVSANPRFVFTAKLWQKFTHDPSATPEDERAVRAGFDVLHKAGKLGAVLLQFPFAFHRTAETTAYLSAVLKRFADYPLAMEVRHATWNDPEVFARLREQRVAFCNIDQP